MHFIREAIFKAAAWITGNKVAQRLLRENIRYSQFLIGMGLGDVRLSGEDAAIRLALKISKGPVCIFDVGANRGEYTNLVLRCCPGRRVAIHAFEPSQTAAGSFLENVQAGPDIYFNRMALSSSTGSAQLFYDNPGSVYASMTQGALLAVVSKCSKSETIQMDTLLDYCACHGIDRIDLLKTDVEGHELEVMRGAGDMLNPRRIQLIQFEFGTAQAYTRKFFRDFWDLLVPIGYRIARITPSGYLEKISCYSVDLEVFRTQNFLAMGPNVYVEDCK
ncbi:MAG: FkbM family methyltransferase [Syntrophobacteraceae bacterium]|jgi:FkbM family methyltransferase